VIIVAPQHFPLRQKFWRQNNHRFGFQVFQEAPIQFGLYQSAHGGV